MVVQIDRYNMQPYPYPQIQRNAHSCLSYLCVAHRPLAIFGSGRVTQKDINCYWTNIEVFTKYLLNLNEAEKSGNGNPLVDQHTFLYCYVIMQIVSFHYACIDSEHYIKILLGLISIHKVIFVINQNYTNISYVYVLNC